MLILNLREGENKHLCAFSHVQITPAYLKDAGFWTESYF